MSITNSNKSVVNIEIDEFDRKLLNLISRDCPTSYSMWNRLRKEAEGKKPGSSMKVMVYKNVNRRVLLLAAAKYIEEVKHSKKAPHGRIEYRLTMKGLRELLPYMFSLDPSGGDEGSIIGHIDKFGLDKKEFGSLLIGMIFERIITIDNLVGVAISASLFDIDKLVSIMKNLKLLRDQIIEDLMKTK